MFFTVVRSDDVRLPEVGRQRLKTDIREGFTVT